MARLFLLLHYFLFCSSAASAFDVTSILSQFSDFSTFTYLLARTRLAGEINARNGGVTVLAVQNGGLPIAAMSDQPDDVLKKILSLHVILDYLDATRLHRMSTHTAILTTLFQASGRASGLDGFLNITDVDKGGRVAISSAVPGSPPGSYFVKVLVTLPQSISVLQISNVILPPETGGAWSDGGRAVAESLTPTDASQRMAPKPPLSPSTAPPPPTPASMIGFPSGGESPVVAPEHPDMPTWPYITFPPDASPPTPSTVAEEAPPPAASPNIAPTQPTRPHVGLPPRTSRRPTWPSNGMPPGGSIVMGPTGPPSQLAPDIPQGTGREPWMGPTSPQQPAMAPLQPLLPPSMAAAAPFRWPFPRSPPGEAPARSQRTEPTESPGSAPPRTGPGSSPAAPRVAEMEPVSPEFPGGIVRLAPSLTPSASRRRLISKPPSEAMSSESNPMSTSTLDPTSPPRTSVTQGESQGVAGVTSVAVAVLAVLLGAFCL